MKKQKAKKDPRCKYDVNFDVAKIAKLFKEGKNVSQISIAIGYPKNVGQNRTRKALVQAGLLK
jgi:hypothetical protein